MLRRVSVVLVLHACAPIVSQLQQPGAPHGISPGQPGLQTDAAAIAIVLDADQFEQEHQVCSLNRRSVQTCHGRPAWQVLRLVQSIRWLSGYSAPILIGATKELATPFVQVLSKMQARRPLSACVLQLR